MDVKERKARSMEQMQHSEDIRKGPWSVEEDTILVNYVATHGDGRWNSVAHRAGLKRSGKSCRLRWLNYLRPDVRRGNLTLQEQITILDLHSRWGNRWSKIARHLPGRTDNEIKNYWRTRVIKQARNLKCDVDSKQFKDALRYVWMPRLIERIQLPLETYGPAHINPSQPDPNPTVQALVHHQHGSGSGSGTGTGTGTESPNQTYPSCGIATASDSSGVDLQVRSDSEEVDYNVSGVCQIFNDQNFELGNTVLPLGGGDLMESLWDDDSIWLTRQLCDDLEIKDNFLV